MATLKGVNRTKADLKPADNIDANEHNGRLYQMYDQIDLSTDGASIADVLQLTKLPQGAKVYEVLAKFGAMGASVTLNIGLESDADAFGAAVDVSSAGIHELSDDATLAGFGLEITAEGGDSVQAVVAGANIAAGAGKLLEVVVIYSQA